MMPINRVNNDQNINRVYTKMSEEFTINQNNTKLCSTSENNVNYFDSLTNRDDLDLSYDHMYATNDNNINLINLTDNNCQTAESEVKFLKDWLILHLDLIQQQNDEILNKERTILILQQENEMLKERISCMERGAPYQETKFFNNHTNKYLEDDFKEDMTQGSGQLGEDNKNCIDLLDLNSDNVDEDDEDDDDGDEDEDDDSLKLNNYVDNNNELSDDNESQNNLNHSDFNNYKSDVNFINNISENIKSESVGVTDCNNSGEFDFTISNSSKFDPMRNLRMSIRRKRLCSNSSALSNNDSVLEEKRSFRRIKKRRKRVIKDSQILTTSEPYVTQIGDLNLGIISSSQSAPSTLVTNNNTNLEVPRWRVKVYSSCYTMEGTENLDDEIYNKRHSRLENDERRRKRWDVQRIREQRVIEKLKQRQERVGSASRNDEQNICLQSFWPKIEDIRYLEVSDQLPVSAFGCPVPKITPSEFSLPWLNNPNVLTIKKVPTRRSTGRRKNTKR